MKKVVTDWNELCEAIQIAKKEDKVVYIKEIYGKKNKDKREVKKIESITVTTVDEKYDKEIERLRTNIKILYDKLEVKEE